MEKERRGWKKKVFQIKLLLHFTVRYSIFRFEIELVGGKSNSLGSWSFLSRLRHVFLLTHSREFEVEQFTLLAWYILSLFSLLSHSSLFFEKSILPLSWIIHCSLQWFTWLPPPPKPEWRVSSSYLVALFYWWPFSWKWVIVYESRFCWDLEGWYRMIQDYIKDRKSSKINSLPGEGRKEILSEWNCSVVCSLLIFIISLSLPSSFHLSFSPFLTPSLYFSPSLLLEIISSSLFLLFHNFQVPSWRKHSSSSPPILASVWFEM